MIKILIVGNRTVHFTQVYDDYTRAGFHVDVVNVDIGESFFSQKRSYDLITFVGKETLINKCEMIRMLRRHQNDVPLIVISYFEDVYVKAQALNVGADDLLSVPFEEQELIARACALVRRARGFNTDSVIRIGNIHIDGTRRVVFVNKDLLHLTSKEFAILEFLSQRRGITLNKKMILERLYNGSSHPEIKIIDVFICKLRKKLLKAGADDVIITVWGRGYMIQESTTSASLTSPS